MDYAGRLFRVANGLEDHAERAIRAGLAAIAGVESLKTPAGEPLQSRIGIASGSVVVGDLAGGGILDRGQVAGETPNLAARFRVPLGRARIPVGSPESSALARISQTLMRNPG